MADITRGSGPDQLPQGAATEVNNLPDTMSAQAGAEQVQAGAQAAGAGTPQPATGATASTEQGAVTPEPDILAALGGGRPPQAPVNWTPQSESDKAIFAPNDETPGHAIGGSLTAGALPLPQTVKENLPLLQRAAMDPNASPATRALVALIGYHASQGG